MRKLVSSFLSFIFLFSTMSAIAYKEYEYEIIGDFKYVKGTNEIHEYIGTSPICELPENTVISGWGETIRKDVTTIIINKNIEFRVQFSQHRMRNIEKIIFKEGITEIKDKFAYELKTLKSVTLPSTLETIGNESFYGCSNLEDINLPQNLKSIGDKSFYECKNLKVIDFPDGLEVIGKQAFANSGLYGDLILPSSLISLGGFGSCEFDNVYLPEGLETWSGAKHVKNLYLPDSMLDNPPAISYADNIIFNSDITVDLYRAFRKSPWCTEKYIKRKTDKTTGDYKDFIVVDNAILKYVGSERNVVIPDGITRIVQDAFRGADIDTVTFPDSLEVIERTAFYETALKEVIIPANVKEIGISAFDYCPMITKVVIEGTPVVGASVFAGSGGLNEDFGILEIKDPDFEAPEEFYDFVGCAYTPWAWYFWNDRIDEIPDWMYDLEHSPASSGMRILIDKENERNAKKTEEKKTTQDDKENDVSKKDDNIKADETDDKKDEVDDKKDDEQKPTDSQSITVWSENEKIKMSVDDKEVIFPDALPFVDENSRTLSPIRAISEAAGFTVAWDSAEQKVTISKDGNIIILYIGSPLVSVNGKAVTMDTKAQIINGRTYIPVRFIGESLGYEVLWK